FRFGIEHDVAFSKENSGSWAELDNGDRIWRLGVKAEDATSISFLFDRFVLHKGAELFIWNSARTEFLGSFSFKNNKKAGVFPVSLLHSDAVVIEYLVPAGVDEGELSLGMVVQGYRAIINQYEDEERGPYGNSGACNINVNCPEGADWQIEKKSVALIIDGGNASCTGALVNNTANDGTPYFLTANHCLGNPNTWVYLFNHEATNCNGSSGPTLQTISSGDLVASNGGSDFALIELSSAPPASYEVQYVGWDRSDDESVTASTSIHHPSGDVMKICFDEDNPYHANQGGAAVWYIDEWEDGVTEPGSSGSPLFDQNHRIIGQLYGGYAACSGEVNNGEADWYGRFGVSWDGDSPETRLKDWLDPQNVSPSVLDGWPEGAVQYANDASVSINNEIEGVLCQSTIYPTATIFNNGEENLTEAVVTVQLNGNTLEQVNWSGSLGSSQSAVVNLSPQELQNGENIFQVTVESEDDENESNNSSSVTFDAVTIENPSVFQLNLTLDEYPEETTWEVSDGATVLASGGPYSVEGALVVEEFCLPEGCFVFTIYDEASDGLCCDYGEGSYTIENQLNVEVASSNGEFTSEETQDFCASVTNVNENENTSVQFFPNPTSGRLTVMLDEANSMITVYDISGRKVIQVMNSASGILELDTENLTCGTYVLSVSSKRGDSRGVFLKE
ncbi:MAG TPA: lysyl endopeptidase, partial [Flavobacteriales bacterium]|nr:lysyl endopeptidase [Flavobacteriales bacterium]